MTEVMGGKQLCFSDYELTIAKKRTKREKFLSEMELVAGLIQSLNMGWAKASAWPSPASP